MAGLQLSSSLMTYPAVWVPLHPNARRIRSGSPTRCCPGLAALAGPLSRGCRIPCPGLMSAGELDSLKIAWLESLHGYEFRVGSGAGDGSLSVLQATGSRSRAQLKRLN